MEEAGTSTPIKKMTQTQQRKARFFSNETSAEQTARYRGRPLEEAYDTSSDDEAMLNLTFLDIKRQENDLINGIGLTSNCRKYRRFRQLRQSKERDMEAKLRDEIEELTRKLSKAKKDLAETELEKENLAGFKHYMLELHTEEMRRMTRQNRVTRIEVRDLRNQVLELLNNGNESDARSDE